MESCSSNDFRISMENFILHGKPERRDENDSGPYLESKQRNIRNESMYILSIKESL